MNNKDLIRQYVDTGIQIPEYQMNQLPNNLVRTYIRKRIINTSRTHDNVDGYELAMFPPEEFVKYINNSKYIKLPEEDFNKLNNDLLPYYFKLRSSDLTSYNSDFEDYEFNRMDSNMKEYILQSRYNLAINPENYVELNDAELLRLDDNQQKKYILQQLNNNNLDIDYETRQAIYNNFSTEVIDTILDWIISRGQQLEDDEINKLNPRLKDKYIKTQLKKGNEQ